MSDESMTLEQAVAELQSFASAEATESEGVKALPPFVKPLLLRSLRVVLRQLGTPAPIADAIVAFVSDALDSGLKPTIQALIQKLLDLLKQVQAAGA